ncbi:MAG: hypothetical protein ABSG41_27820 [Bryobacteraceae bacterium]
MEVTPADFRRHFELLSDAALLETNREDLVEMARECFDEEVSRRGLDVTDDSPEIAGQTGEPQPGNGEGLVLIGTFVSGDEVNLVRGLLESASIPSHVVNPLGSLAGIEFRLMVPAAFEEQAMEVLDMQISDEELAAQAEAAAMFEADPEEEEEELRDPHP